MLRILNLLLLSILFTATYGHTQAGLGTLKGSVTDVDSKQPVEFAKIILKQDGQVKGGTETDMDGKFQINAIEPGSYDVEVRNETEGYQSSLLTGVIISANQITFLDKLTLGKADDVKEVEEVVITSYRVPLINKDGGSSGGTVTREDIARLPVRSAAGVAATVGGVNTDEGSGEISVRGSRSDGTYFYIDGIKVRGSSSLPKSAIEEVSVITGGVPANYGDVTGGIISVTTRGPSAKYFGSLELVTSGFYFKGKDPNGYDGKVFGLDKYGYNLVEGLFSGPLLMRKDSTGTKTKPILGFLLSVNMTDQLDGRPLAGGSYRIKKDVREELLANPLRPSSDGTTTFHNALFLRSDDFEKTPFRMNARNNAITGQGKIDVNTGPTVNLTFGGSFNYTNGSLYSYSNSLLNFENFGVSKSLDWRVYGRFSQRFNNTSKESSSKIKSANYNLMVDFSRSQDDQYDPKHKYNLFNYGHVGTFTTFREKTYEGRDTDGDNVNDQYVQNGTKDVVVTFTPSDLNPSLAAITSQYYQIYANDPIGHYENLQQIQQGNALRNGDVPTSVYSIWGNIGAPYDYFGKTQNDQFRITGSGSVVVSDHSITLGFEYEQRWDRGWTAGTSTNGGGNGPIGIWTVARQLANAHIKELDLNSGVLSDSGSFSKLTYQQLNTGYAANQGNGAFGGAENNDSQYFFDYNARLAVGLDPAGTDFLDIDRYDPNTFGYDMFAPDELLNGGNSLVSYWGYDHTGEKVKGNTDVNKYFTSFDDNGNYERFVGAFQPIYISTYVMDKFAFRDIIFNVGVRADIFDANQPVLKDRYLFYNANSVSEARALANADPNNYTWFNVPSSIGDDYIVYVNDINNPTAINGFRDGTQWYNAEGLQVSDPSVLRGPAGIQPFLTTEGKAAFDNGSPTASAFEDYTRQVNIMPRIAFSFPISDEASFFAHYDILTKRPTTGNRFDPFQYQFINARSAIINNSNLLPETTIDYELGFQQVLTRTSALKISAFYREQRDNVQLISVFEAFPKTYRTFGNRDFGTVKGLTVSYDLRRTGNVRLTAAYTLQFADGTGSDATSASALIQAGLPNLRAIFPYDFDQRHAFAITFDYRYGEGKDYNGPMAGDFEIFGNTGLNIFTQINSGSPYSNQTFITNEGNFTPQGAGLNGTTNGSRLPWTYRLDLQLDRTFNLQLGKEDKKKATFLNVYVRVTNLFNKFNVLNVYRATGVSDDDGYLAAAQYQTTIQNQLDEQAFREYYALKVDNPFNVSQPRTIRLGIKFDF